ncbi:hypothetical protein H1R20_g9356, partial [Candolleomyces eurysporus]
MASIVNTDPSDWRYVSEGGATIVFSYHGPPNPEFDGTVLRLRKALVPSLKTVVKIRDGEVHKPQALDGEDEPDDPTIEYQTKCMAKLIPPEHLPRLETVKLDQEWLQRLVQLENLKRPEGRREKDGIDVDRKKGVLATDLVGGNWLAAEIKPKWAFLPSPTHLSEETNSIKSQTCRFCMHNHLRKSNGDIIEMNYCPLDLFSGDEARITKAIHGLWDAWTESGGTVNNLKVFAKGKTLRPAETSLMLADGVDASSTTREQIRDAFTSALRRTLIKTPVLGILSRLQRTLDVLDIEGLSKLWRTTERAAPLYRTTFESFFAQPDGTSPPPTTPLGVSSLFLSSPEPAIPDWVDFLNTYLSPFSSQLDHSNPEPKNLRYYLLAYLLSATFKDCSIIVRLDFVRPGIEPKIEVKPNTVTVIDLDPKSLDKLRGWEKLDKEISGTYSLNSARKTCIDAFSSST